jgi:hypothetical protein
MIKYLDREIYEVSAKAVDTSGGYNNLSGYPISFDSHQNNDDCDKAYFKAMAAYSDAEKLGYTAAQSGRPLTIVSLLRISDGMQLKKTCIGKIPMIEIEVPDPEPEPEPDVEPEQNGGE